LLNVPRNYDFIPLLTALKKYNYFSDLHKYRNNYDYQLALLIMGNKLYMTNEMIILTENDSIFSPISQLNYSFYDDKKILTQSLQANQQVQAIVGNGFVDFGKAQTPALSDYADGIDTMEFLLNLQVS